VNFSGIRIADGLELYSAIVPVGPSFPPKTSPADDGALFFLEAVNTEAKPAGLYTFYAGTWYTSSLTFTPVNRAGDTMTGPLTLAGSPTSALHAATKQYVDGLIPSADTLTNTTVLNLANQLAVNLTTLNGIYLRTDGTNALTANLNAGSNRLTNVANPTSPQDAATKAYVDASAATVHLNNLLGATAPGSLLNAAFSQSWLWQLTGNTTAFTIGEAAPATGANNVLLKVLGQASTTADLLRVALPTVDLLTVTGAGGLSLTTAAEQSIVLAASGTLPTTGRVRVVTNSANRLAINGDGSWEVNGTVGTSGQVLSSAGPGASPPWASLPPPLTSLPYDVAFYSAGGMQASGTTVSGVLLPRNVFISTTASHRAYVLTAPTNPATYDIVRVVTTPTVTQTVIGTVTFAASANTGTVTITANVTVQANDLLLLRANTPTIDPTLAELFVTLVGCSAAAACSLGP